MVEVAIASGNDLKFKNNQKKGGKVKKNFNFVYSFKKI